MPSPRHIRSHALLHDAIKTPAGHIIERSTIDINPKVAESCEGRTSRNWQRTPDTDSVIPAKAGIQTSSERNGPQISQLTTTCSFGILTPDLVFPYPPSFTGRYHAQQRILASVTQPPRHQTDS
jgi:hypothetical protein